MKWNDDKRGVFVQKKKILLVVGVMVVVVIMIRVYIKGKGGNKVEIKHKKLASYTHRKIKEGDYFAWI